MEENAVLRTADREKSKTKLDSKKMFFNKFPRVVKVSTGNGFICLLTDRGILLTKGSGHGGCLGHGNEVRPTKLDPGLATLLKGDGLF